MHENSSPALTTHPTKDTRVHRALASSTLPASDRRLHLLLSAQKKSWPTDLLSHHPQVLMFSFKDPMMTAEAAVHLAEQLFHCADEALSHVVDVVNEQLEDGAVPWCGSRLAKLRTSDSGVYCEPAPKAVFRQHCLAHSVAVQLSISVDMLLLCEQLQSVRWSSRVLHMNCEQSGVKGGFGEEDLRHEDGCSGLSVLCVDASDASSSSVVEFLNFCDLFNDVQLTSSLIHHHGNAS